MFSSFSNMRSRSSTSLPSPPSLSVFRHCLPQHCLFVLHGTSFQPLSQLQCQESRNGNYLWSSHLSSNSTNPPLLHAIHKRLSIYCLVAFFPSLLCGLFSSTCLSQTMWAWRGREGTAPQFWHTKSMLVCMLSSGQKCPMVLVGGTFLLYWPAALHNLSGWPQLVQLAKHPVVQNVAIWNDQGDLEWGCMYLLFKYLSCHDQDAILNSAFFIAVIWMWSILGKIFQTEYP